MRNVSLGTVQSSLAPRPHEISAESIKELRLLEILSYDWFKTFKIEVP